MTERDILLRLAATCREIIESKRIASKNNPVFTGSPCDGCGLPARGGRCVKCWERVAKALEKDAGRG